MAKRPAQRRRNVKKSPRKAARSSARTPRATASTQNGGQPTRLADMPRRDGAQNVPANFHALYDRGFRSARGLAPAAPAPTPSRTGRRLAQSVTGLEIHYDQTTQLPNMIVCTTPQSTLTAPRGAGARGAARAARTPEGAVVDFVQSRADLWQLTPEDAATIHVVSVSQPQPPAAPVARARGAARARSEATFDVSKLKTVNLIQRVDGSEVFNSDTTAAVNADNEVIAVAGQFFPGTASSATRSRARKASPRAARGRGAEETATPAEEAIARAAFDLTNVPYSSGDFV